MKCDVCKVKMDNSTTELEVSVKGKTLKAINVPCLLCPKCNALIIKNSIKKQAQAYAKHCKGNTFDYAKEEAAATAAVVAATSVVV